MHDFFIKFHGPKDIVYHGYVWNLRVQIPVDYPYWAPFIHFLDTIYHPNIDVTTGGICLNVLEESWSAMGDLVAVFEIFIPQLLKYPNPNDPHNREAAALLLADPATYEARVREYCERYATPEETSQEEKEDDEIDEMSDSEDEDAINKMGKMVIQETKDENASGDQSVSGKADDP
ncbi:ubiquitin-protein ligase [Lithospermum erythrorhizon]|uniref:Ubiquitin-protein ligase n=1 Tax=Lithospermum erythrorhizon TaxID=34254 RepID=A0AAV3RL30_LITER